MKFGDLVTYTDSAYRNGVPTRKQIKNGAVGVCCNFDTESEFVMILWKGNKYASYYSKDFIKLKGVENED